MEDLVILVLLAIIFFLMWNARNESRYELVTTGSTTKGPVDAPVPPAMTQAIIAKVQQEAKTIWPLETLYIKKSDTDTYDARFMFFNTDGYYGTQYDVKAKVADGSVQILSKSETALEGDAQNPGYVPDEYQSYDVIEKSLNSQLEDALQTYSASRQ